MSLEFFMSTKTKKKDCNAGSALIVSYKCVFYNRKK